jgi:hypothetical protein
MQSTNHDLEHEMSIYKEKINQLEQDNKDL